MEGRSGFPPASLAAADSPWDAGELPKLLVRGGLRYNEGSVAMNAAFSSFRFLELSFPGFRFRWACVFPSSRFPELPFSRASVSSLRGKRNFLTEKDEIV